MCGWLCVSGVLNIYVVGWVNIDGARVCLTMSGRYLLAGIYLIMSQDLLFLAVGVDGVDGVEEN